MNLTAFHDDENDVSPIHEPLVDFTVDRLPGFWCFAQQSVHKTRTVDNCDLDQGMESGGILSSRQETHPLEDTEGHFVSLQMILQEMLAELLQVRECEVRRDFHR